MQHHELIWQQHNVWNIYSGIIPFHLRFFYLKSLDPYIMYTVHYSLFSKQVFYSEHSFCSMLSNTVTCSAFSLHCLCLCLSYFYTPFLFALFFSLVLSLLPTAYLSPLTSGTEGEVTAEAHWRNPTNFKYFTQF